MIVCKTCGQRNESDATFCATCSAFLEWTGEHVEGPPAPGPVTPRALPGARNAHPGPVPMTSDRTMATILLNAVQTVDPGSQVVFILEIRNLGSTVDRLTIEVLGDAAAWAEVDPPALNLMPGTSGSVNVTFRPLHNAAVRAGDVSFGLGVRSAEHPAASGLERGVIRINAFSEFEVDLAPRVRPGRRSGSFAIRATNNGNVPISLDLAGSDPEGALRFGFRPSTLDIEPGATTVGSVAVSASGSFLLGSRRPRPFQILVTPANQPRRTLEEILQQTALVPLWVPAGLAIGVAAIAALVVAIPPGGRPPASAPSTQAPATAAPRSQAPQTPEARTPEPGAWWQDAHAAAAAQGIDLGPPAAAGTTAENLRYEEFRNGAIYERTDSVYVLSDAIWRKWKTLGGGASPPATLGYPVSALLGPDLDNRRQLFERGAIYWSAQSGAHVVDGSVWQWWQVLVDRQGGDVARPTELGLVEAYGYPISDVTSDELGNETIQLQHGNIGFCDKGNGNPWACLAGDTCADLCAPMEPILPSPAP